MNTKYINYYNHNLYIINIIINYYTYHVTNMDTLHTNEIVFIVLYLFSPINYNCF